MFEDRVTAGAARRASVCAVPGGRQWTAWRNDHEAAADAFGDPDVARAFLVAWPTADAPWLDGTDPDDVPDSPWVWAVSCRVPLLGRHDDGSRVTGFMSERGDAVCEGDAWEAAAAAAAVLLWRPFRVSDGRCVRADLRRSALPDGSESGSRYSLSG